MEAAPPTYETATLIDVWDIVARYLPSSDLCSAALVCDRWHRTFTPYIWGNPASHFGIQNDAVYVALTRFKRTLKTARLLVRSHTHTLHLPPAHAEIYNGPHADWLRDILERLPNLQSLIVRGLPFFDYAALQALGAIQSKPQEHDNLPTGAIELPGSAASLFQVPQPLVPAFGLRLLDASRCPNVTSSGLASALSRFEGLLYLDLSFSYPARDIKVLNTLRKFTGLQVLKLRGISLRDDGVGFLGKAIGLRVRSLDLRDNHITDRGVRILLDHCFAGAAAASSFTTLPSGQRSPTLLPYLGSEMLEIYQGEDFEGFLRNAFTGRFVSRLAIEDVPDSGITHLYIAGNPITVEGVSGLVRSERLHVLDVGSVANDIARPSNDGTTELRMEMPGIEKLTPVVSKHAADAMTFLRIDHSLVTKETPNLHPEEVIHGRVELGDSSLPYNTNNFAELGGTSVQPLAFELAADGQTPRYELEADPMQFVISPAPATDETFRVSNPSDEYPQARRGSVLAPEVVDTLAEEMTRSDLLSPVSAMDEGTMNGINGLVSPVACSPGTSTPPTPKPRPRSYSSMATERSARLNAHCLTRNNLHPAMVPHVSTLVLTEVPPYSSDRDVADCIITFIKNCAQEASHAQKQAKLDYSAPPGRRGHMSALKHSADKIFALKRLVLELDNEKGGRRNSKASPWIHQDTRSMTEDRDSEALWSAAETDFSFFGDEECVFPTLETGRFSFYTGPNEKEVNIGQPMRSPITPKSPEIPTIDNIALISAFRKERKLVRQRSIAAGNYEAEIDGLWDGVVQVVRSNTSLRNDEEMDYYGNKFTNNGLYR